MIWSIWAVFSTYPLDNYPSFLPCSSQSSHLQVRGWRDILYPCDQL